MKKPLQIQFDFQSKYHEMTGDYIKIYYCQDCYKMYFEDEQSKHEDHLISWLYQGQNACKIPELKEKCVICGTTWEISQLDENKCCMCKETQKLKDEGYKIGISTLQSNLRLIKSQKNFRRSLNLLMASEIAFVVVAIHFVWMMLK